MAKTESFVRPSVRALRFEAWARGLSVLLRGSREERLRHCFGVYDLNADGYITRDEMFLLLKNSLLKQPGDEDPDEGVRELVELVLKKLDADKDGRVSLEDYKTFCDYALDTINEVQATTTVREVEMLPEMVEHLLTEYQSKPHVTKKSQDGFELRVARASGSPCDDAARCNSSDITMETARDAGPGAGRRPPRRETVSPAEASLESCPEGEALSGAKNVQRDKRDCTRRTTFNLTCYSVIRFEGRLHLFPSPNFRILLDDNSLWVAVGLRLGWMSANLCICRSIVETKGHRGPSFPIAMPLIPLSVRRWFSRTSREPSDLSPSDD
ncbi:EF-hand calcium-binding domain-containing protein 1 [Eumeta japonica]|uniref:EF-hand calcium-binding domain-containing protein 1 n=1 Tax=Eumeta variegata TaxID=151549 RepID=A0A4C1VJX9_EUMVA|nr:EF-hand calcium-binding domain-containing protein 1 [Eumeta japonica]